MKQPRFFGLLLLASLSWSSVQSQTTYYYRSQKSGNWNDTLSWQWSSDYGDSWSQASSPPSGSEYIIIQSGHTVTAAQSLTVSSMTVEGGGQLTLAEGQTLTVPSGGEGASLSLNGTLMIKGTLDATVRSISSGGSGLVIYAGSTTQTIAPISYFDLQINNPAGAQLSGATVVDGALTLTNGSLQTGSNTLELGSYATVSETSQFRVLGMLYTSRACTLGVNEPFGGMGVEISRSGGPSVVMFSVTRYTGGAPSITAANAVARSFDISPTINSGHNASLVLHYFPSELNGADESALVLYKLSGGPDWTKVGGAVNTSSHSVSIGGIDSFSSWTAAAPIPVPTITSVSPTSGTRGSGMSVTIVGTNFASGSTSVGFSSSDITVNSVTVSSPTQLSAAIAISASAPTGFRDVTVTNSYGTASYSNAFQVQNPAPTLTNISPPNGALGTSLSLNIQGSGFISGVTTVSVGAGITVNSISVTNGNQLVASIAIAPGATLGPRSVVVTNPSPGGGIATLSSGFSVLPVPSCSNVTPATGARGQTLSVLFTGSNFVSGGTTVDMGPNIALDSVTVLSATQIRARASIAYSAATGPRNVSVSNSGGSSGVVTLPGGFSVMNPAPVTSSINPTVAARGKTVTVAVIGSEFISGVTSVSFGSGLSVGSTAVTSTTQLSAVVSVAKDAVLGSRDVTVTNVSPGGGTSALAAALSVQNPAPLLVSLSPVSGQLGQNLNVELLGSDFLGSVSSVDFGPGVTVNSTAIDSTGGRITANISISSGALAGFRTVKVTNLAPGGGVSNLANAFTVMNPVPTLTGAAPYEGAKGQTLNVTLVGTNFFAGASSVTFGVGVTVNTVTVNSITSIVANISISPSAVVGARSITVTNAAPGGGSASLPFVFNVVNQPPTITSFAPSSGTRGSLYSATIMGSNFFSPGTTLNLGTGIVVTSLSVVSPTQMTADIAIALDAVLGTRTVNVTNPLPGGGSASLTSGFTVSLGPATGVEGALGSIPDDYLLQEAYPNPFNPSTRIRYGVPEDSRIRLTINNMLGNIVAQLVNGERSKGVYELQWHADNLPSGVYLVRMNAESMESSRRFIASRKIILMK